MQRCASAAEVKTNAAEEETQGNFEERKLESCSERTARGIASVSMQSQAAVLVLWLMTRR